MTQFALPFIAILSSGLLAIFLQRRDHRKLSEERSQEARDRAADRKKEDEERQEERLRIEKRIMVERATQDHDHFVSFALEETPANTVAVLRLSEEVMTDFTAMMDREYIAVGFWLAKKRLRAVKMIAQAGHGPETGTDVSSYFINVKMLLGFWRNGVISDDWFVADERRIADGIVHAFKHEEAEFMKAFAAIIPNSSLQDGL